MASIEKNPASAGWASFIWNNDFLGAETVAVLPYEPVLKRFPAYLQQLTILEKQRQASHLDGRG